MFVDEYALGVCDELENDPVINPEAAAIDVDLLTECAQSLPDLVPLDIVNCFEVLPSNQQVSVIKLLLAYAQSPSSYIVSLSSDRDTGSERSVSPGITL